MKLHTDKQVAGLRSFKPGESGNSAGRPPGARNRLSTKFLSDLLEIWEQQGKEALARIMKRQPGLIVRVIAHVMPKEITHRTEGALQNITDEQLNDIVRNSARELAARAIRTSAEGTASPPSTDKLN
jgi:hypothetical protein